MLIQEDTLVMICLPTVYFIGKRQQLLLKAGLNLHRATSHEMLVDHPTKKTQLLRSRANGCGCSHQVDGAIGLSTHHTENKLSVAMWQEYLKSP